MTALLFIALSAVIVFAGSALCRIVDRLAAASGTGRTVAGLVLLATATSLPELFAGLSSVLTLKAPDLAVAGLLGSCMFNLFVFSVLDAFVGDEPLSTRVERGHLLSMGFALVLVSVFSLSLLAPALVAPIGWIGVSTPLMLVLYVAATRTSFRWQERSKQEELDLGPTLEPGEKRKLWAQYAGASILVIAAASAVPPLAQSIAESTGVSQSFIGNSLVALATSLPELVVALAALRMDAPDMAFATILGSNLFNLALVPVLDLAYIDGPLLAAASSEHLISAAAMVIMTAVLVIGVTYATREKEAFIAWDSWAILATYLVGLGLLAT